MHEPVEICRLTPSETPRLRELNTLFGEAFGDPETYGGAPPSETYLRDLLGKDHVIALVPLADGAVVGVWSPMNSTSSKEPDARSTFMTWRFRSRIADAA